ncbi:MAG: PepSY domain-containing protein [Granulosicoccus sp.]
MNKFTSAIALTILAATSTLAQAADMTEEEAIAKALELHPGTVTEAYRETKKGVELWEVKITDENGLEWKTFYRIDNGEYAIDKRAQF